MKYPFSSNKNTAHHTQIGLCFMKDGISIASIEKQNTSLSVIEKIDEMSTVTLQTLLRKRVEELNLQGALANIILLPSDYQLFLVELPGVNDNEKRDALRWKVAEYIDYPIEEAIIDYIELPPKADLKAAKLAYVVVAKKEKMDSLTKWVEQAHLKVKSIDIGQSALMKIANRLIDSDIGQALLYLENDKSHLLIFKDKTLYLMRELAVGWNKINETEKADRYAELSLEIQRSLDYCASNMKNITVSRLILTPCNGNNDELLVQLSEALGLPVREMSFSEILNVSDEHSMKINQNLIAIGAAL